MQNIIGLLEEYAEESLELLEEEIAECLKLRPGQKGMSKAQADQLDQAWHTVKNICKVKHMIHDYHKNPGTSSHHSGTKFLTYEPMQHPHLKAGHNPGHQMDPSMMETKPHHGNPY